VPELPEVETTVNDLKPFVVNKRIENVDVLWNGNIAAPSVEQFRKGLTGRKIVSLTRRGKLLIFALDDDKFWIVHMRMTGSLLLKKATEKPEKPVGVIIYLDNGTAIHFRDMRHFGKMWLVKDVKAVTGKLGPEPLEPEFTPGVLAKILHNRKTAIKGLLLDQTLIAGIGNMYADETLYASRIHPMREASSLTKAEVKRLHEAIEKVLTEAIRNKGASTETYIRPEGAKGEAHLQFQVAHQRGKDCPVCGGPIERIEVHQRGTYFCPKCQKLPRNKPACKTQKLKVKV
jgi:formamidopyrimidine-DNA glycosylase